MECRKLNLFVVQVLTMPDCTFMLLLLVEMKHCRADTLILMMMLLRCHRI